MWVTEDCVDDEFDRPVIDAEVDVAEPVRHRRVTGHFEGTDVRFAFYLSPAENWEGRFFQSVYPLESEEATDRTLRFAHASGGYTVQTNSSSGYRSDAAAAKFSRTGGCGRG